MDSRKPAVKLHADRVDARARSVDEALDRSPIGCAGCKQLRQQGHACEHFRNRRKQVPRDARKRQQRSIQADDTSVMAA